MDHIGKTKGGMENCRVLRKALDILTLLTGAGEGMRLFEIVELLNLPRPTVIRLVKALADYGLIEKSGRCYRLTAAFFDWSSRDRYAALRRRYRGVLETVSKATGELVLLGVQSGNAIVHIDVIECDHAVRVAPAPTTRHNLQSSALGKLALSRSPHLRSAVRSSRILAELAEVDRTGVAWNREESNAGVIALAMWGMTTGATDAMIAVAWPAFRFNAAKGRRACEAVRTALAQNTVN